MGPLKEGADPAEAVGQLCVRPAQTPKPQAGFSMSLALPRELPETSLKVLTVLCAARWPAP